MAAQIQATRCEKSHFQHLANPHNMESINNLEWINSEIINLKPTNLGNDNNEINNNNKWRIWTSKYLFNDITCMH